MHLNMYMYIFIKLTHTQTHTHTQQVEFIKGYVPGTINFSLGVAEGAGAIVGVEDGNFAIWVSSHTPTV